MPKKNKERHGNILGVCCTGDIHGSVPERRGWSNCDDYNCSAGKGSIKANRVVQKDLAKEIQQRKKNKKSDIDFYLNNNKSNDTEDHPTDDTVLSTAVAHTLLSSKYLKALNKTKGKNLTEKELEEKYLALGLDADFFADFYKFYNRYNSAKGEYGPAFYKLMKRIEKRIGKASPTSDEIAKEYKKKKDEIRKGIFEITNVDYDSRDTKTTMLSWGNGAAMRVGMCGFAADSLAEARALAKVSAVNTHENELAIKGAQMIASFIFLARIGLDMQEIKAYMNYMYRTDEPVNKSGEKAEGFITSCDLDKLSTDEIIKKGYPYCIRCDLTAIPALVSVFESENFFDATDRGYKLAGDCDTMGIMISMMAEAYYGGTEKGASKEFANAAREKLADIEYDHSEKVLIDGKEDNDAETGKDKLMAKISDKLDKNFGDRYRANASKEWQIEKIEQTIDFLRTQAEPAKQKGGKGQELENLIKLLEGRKQKFEIEMKEEQEENNEQKENNNQDFEDDNLTDFKNVLLAAASADYFGAPLEQDVWWHNDNYSGNYKGNLIKNREVQKKIENYIEKNRGAGVDFYLPDKGSKYCKPSSGKYGKKVETEHFTDDTMLMMAVAHTFNSKKYKDILNKTKEKKLTRVELEELYKDLDADVFINFLKFSCRYQQARGECGSSLGKVSTAVAEILGVKGNVELNLLKTKSEDEIKKAYRQVLNKYKDSNEYKAPTKSPTDGVVMRDISGYVANSLEEAKVLARQVAINTHGDKLALEAAEVKAITIFWGRNGWSEQEAANYINYFYRKYDDSFCESNLSPEIRQAEFLAGNYDIKNITTDQIKETAPYLIRADLALVQSLRAFRESKTFIDSVYTVAKLGGDMDTTGITTASMKVAYTVCPKEITDKARKLLPEIEHTDFKIDGLGSKNGPDDVMLKVNDDFDKNYSHGYRKFADKSWQIENTSLILVDLYKEEEKQMSDEKRKDLNDLIESVEKRKLALIENYINILTKKKENEKTEDKIAELNKLIESLDKNKIELNQAIENRAKEKQQKEQENKNKQEQENQNNNNNNNNNKPKTDQEIKQQEYESKKYDIFKEILNNFYENAELKSSWIETIKENKADFRNLCFEMLKVIDDRFESYESETKKQKDKKFNDEKDKKNHEIKDYKAEINKLKSSIECFAKTFGIEKIELVGKNGAKEEIVLSKVLESELDIGRLRVIWEQIKNVLLHFKFMGYDKTKFRMQKDKLMSFWFDNNKKRSKSVEIVRKKINQIRGNKKGDGKDSI